MEKTWYKNTQDKIICGVCSGLAEYLSIDKSLVRVLFAVFGCTGMGLIIYIIAACILPEKPQM